MEELRGCPIAKDETLPMVIVAEFNNISSSKIAFEDKLYSAMRSQFKNDVSLCRYRQTVVKESGTAEKLGEKFASDLPDVIVVWGIYDDRGLVVSISPVHWKAFELNIEVSTSDSRQLEDWSQEYLPQLILSELDHIQGTNARAIRTLNEVINNAKGRNLPVENPKAFAKLDFVLASMYESEYEPDFEADDVTPTAETVNSAHKIIEIYNEILIYDQNYDGARLNRGILFSDLNEIDNALKDFNDLIDKQSSYVALAYFCRASLQPSWDLEELDYRKAIDLNPKNIDFYDALGYSALNAGDFDTAIEAYTKSIPYLNNDTRQLIISDLNDMVIDDPTLQEPVSKIIDLLQRADLK